MSSDDVLLDATLHTIGARSGRPRVTPVMGIPDGDAWLVVGTAAARPRDPGWAFNLRADPHLDLSLNGTREAFRATELHEPARTEAWLRFATVSSHYAGLERKTTRRFPVFRLTPR